MMGIFYPTSTRIENTDDLLLDKIRNHFCVDIKNNRIINGTLRYFFSTFFVLKEKFNLIV